MGAPQREQPAHVVVVISRSTLEAMADVVPALRSRARLIYNGVPRPPEEPGRAARRSPLRAVVVGRLSPRKAPHIALEAVGRLRRRGYDINLEIVGTAFDGYEWYVRELEQRAARSDLAGAVTFLVGGAEDRVPWGQLHREALDLAAELQAAGLRPGGHLALLGPTSRPLVTAIQATWLAGATLVVLPLPMRLGSLEEFTSQTRERVRRADVDLLVVDADLAPFLGEPCEGDPPVALLQDLVAASRAKTARRVRTASA